MTTQTISRLIIATVAVALLGVLLFSGPTTSAAKGGDRSAPTTPTGLEVTAITESTVALKWNPSTDNSGKFSYQVKITKLGNYSYNSLATVSQTQTTYTVKFLSPNTSYSFAVYALDGNGNRSGDSNSANANTPADNTPPSTPVLQATAIAPSQVQLTWTKATDNIANNCCSYSLTRNGSPITQHINPAAAPAGSMSVIIRHLTPGSDNTFTVSAIDFGGKTSTSNPASAQTWPSSDTTPPSVPTNLHIVSDNGGGELWVGWTQSTDTADSQSNIEYEIYVNGVLSPLGVSAGVDVDFVYLLPPCENILTVKAVDKAGNTSAASAPLKYQQWVCN